MNYRHAYHAGNHTEVFKHSILVFLLEHLTQKMQPFFVLDTHAGIGMYDLESNQALLTGEKADGIEKIYDIGIPSCQRYLDIIVSVNAGPLKYYPGSPEISRQMLRPTDRLIACELHPDDYFALQSRYRSDRRVTIQNRSGYEAINALVPPVERRGLVFIDPPFEQKDEVQQMISALNKGMRKWATGIFCLWYPIKGSKIGDAIADAVVSAQHPKSLRIEFLPFRKDGENLAGSGIIICNTPWKLDEWARSLCQDISSKLGDRNGTWSVKWLTAEGGAQ
ncbi:23S rRNA (adenine(2030)-N(6))-methyltransferase RlmJ [Brucella pseudogrignonensis]|uniref:Ribosomal RNA large subunit methyltransferase J n=1 Tax=Brucella pseudogrignonensis TaxID=419475 RepID=A0A7Y3TB71_9HYPH|nr:23S rRNA (adenine(2030)-N(6))-methyltransferase RlmJ [Brucella pseudogrignonensis]MCM0751273.1 23S rRNA (adenine(2030)-N(6))-methyltransferase RlmJ [Brucella pseudogrignonensis]NNV22502.1 23S rRNA (adenine(2030)-N(6))-methyltransferase RlmJ [Brucella pseudogrignonensis]